MSEMTEYHNFLEVEEYALSLKFLLETWEFGQRMKGRERECTRV